MSLKQGLMQLRQYARAKGMKFYTDEKAIIIPIYSFINQLVTSMKNYLNSQQCPYWYIYLVNEHLRDRSFPNIIKSWEKLSISSLECHLLQSLLIVHNKNKLKLYLKARKYIIQTASNSAMLDQILLNVQDAISVIHKLYQNQQIRKALVQGIKNIFMAFKLTQAKIYSSVFIQYLLTVYDSVFKIENEEATISGNISNYKSFQNSQNYIQLYSSIKNFQSGIHDENGLYKKINFTQNTPKKYQIIDRKFIPLKQTSQFLSNQNINKISSSPTKIKASREKEKSSFYDFISHNSQQDNHQVSHQQSTIRHINSFSKSYEKQQFYLLEKEAIQRRNRNSMHDKENSIQSFKISMQRKPITQTKSNPKFSLNRPQNNKPNVETNKNFSLEWFSKKLFETSGDEERDSILRRQKERMKKKTQQRKKLHITSVDSTQKYEIQNHILNERNKHINNQRQRSQQQKQNKQNNIKNEGKYFQSKGQSVKKIQFDMMVSKNQQFKQKILKKNYPSNTSSQYTINSNKMEGIQSQFISNQIMGGSKSSILMFNNNYSRGQRNNSDKYDGNNDPRNGNNNINKLSNQSMLKRDILEQHINKVSPSKIMTVKQRSEMLQNSQSANNLSKTNMNKKIILNNSKNKSSLQKQTNFKKNNKKEQQKEYQLKQKPQIIHNSMGLSRINNFSNDHYYQQQQKKSINSQQNVYLQDQYIDQNQQQQQFLQRSSFDIDKMKKMIRIIDNFRHQNYHQYQESQQINISQSICKKSNFDSNLNPDLQEIENYSFY